MNIRITTFSLLVAATCAIGLNTAAQADEQDVRSLPSNRFDFGSNTYALDHVQSRHHYISTSPGPGNVHSGAAPKNLLGLDPGFLAKPAPPPVAQAPVAQPTVSAKPIIANNSPFSSLFGNPQPQALTAPPAGKFGSPAAAAAKPALVASAPRTFHNQGVNGKLLTHFPHHTPTAAAARPMAPIASYEGGKYYSPGQVNAGYSNGGGATVTTDLAGSIIGRKHH
jgi:hypothetical protein